MDKNLFGEITKILSRLKKCVGKISEFINFQKDIENLIETSQQPLKMLFMGEFSTGKSSFINALIEKNVAVVNAVPTTAIITKFCYGNDEIIAHFRDGSSKKFAQTDFELLTAETKKSQKNIRNDIDFVERKISNDFLRSIEIIDSPGLNSLEKDHSNITQNFISQSDIIVWVFDANKLATKSEIDALKKILPSLKMKPIIVVNKIDELDEDEGDDLESILTEARKKLANSKIDFHSLIGISAELAFKGKIANNKNLIEESNIEKFYEVVNEILQNDFTGYKQVELFDALSAFIFDFGNVLRKKYLDNANDISENYPAYIQNKKILAETEDNFNYLIDFAREYVDAHKLDFELRTVRKTFFGVLDWLTNEDQDYYPNDLEDAAVRNSETAKKILITIFKLLSQKSKADYWTGKPMTNNNFTVSNPFTNGSRDAYMKGRECEKVGNYYTAFSYYQKAAELGNGLAMMAIANMYEIGNSVCKKSDTNALRWYKKAAETGYADAKRKVFELEQKNTYKKFKPIQCIDRVYEMRR